MHVIIVGAGLGGIMLAALLEKAGVSYEVLEKVAEVKPLGSAMSMGAHIFPIFKQLGIYDAIKSEALPAKVARMRSHPDGKVWEEDFVYLKERYGDYFHIIDRPTLYGIIGSLVPKEKIHYNKKVERTEQNDEGVTVYCSDNSIYHGDVIVGADGAYSATRRVLYKEMKSEGLLPTDDDTDPPYNTLCLVGVTNPMPPGSFETVDGECRFESILYRNLPYLTVCFSKKDGGVEWMVVENVGSFRTRDEDRARNSDWRTEETWAMAEKVRDLPTPYGPPLGLFLDNTPKDSISKVMLEEKVYKTWYHRRTVLLGDACHKFHPATGQGAINAMMDAVVLANVLQACPTSSTEDIIRCLDAYQKERFPAVKLAHDASTQGAYLSKRSLVGDISRFIFYNILPKYFVIKAWHNMYAAQPQAAFLPYVTSTGTYKPEPTNYDHLKVSVSVAAV